MADQFNADPGFVRRARPRRDDDSLRSHRFYFFHRDLIVASDLDLRSELANVLDEVVGERIVVVENENQGTLLRMRLHQEAGARDQGQGPEIRFGDSKKLYAELDLRPLILQPCNGDCRNHAFLAPDP